MLKQGIYEHIINNQVEKEISKAKNFGLVCKKQPVDNAESPKILADYLAKVICQKLEDTEAQQDRVNIINRILINAGLMDDTQIVDSTDLRSYESPEIYHTDTEQNRYSPSYFRIQSKQLVYRW